MNHVRQSVCQSMGIQERTGKNETRDAEIHVCARRSGEEVDESRIHQYETELMTKVSHI